MAAPRQDGSAARGVFGTGLGWMRERLLSTPLHAVLTLLLLWLLLLAVPAALDWLVLSARFGAATPQECAAVQGACWAFIAEKHRLILFGLYPYEQQWRPLLACIILTGIVVCSAARRCWRPWLALAWPLALGAVAVLMWGGVAGLAPVDHTQWGGLPLTLILAVCGIAGAFPLGVALALGRRSTLPLVRAVCISYIELIRGVPLISLLFMSSMMLPLFLPEGMDIDKLLRAQLAIVLFVAAYIAETVRGGLQAVPRGQYEGARALGLGYWQSMFTVILPQALAMVIPPLVGIFISLFKDTSLVVIIGIFDLTQAAKTALADARWQGYATEAYLFIALIYFVFCYAMSRYGRALERQWSRH